LTFRSCFCIAGRFFLTTRRFISVGRPSAARRRFDPAALMIEGQHRDELIEVAKEFAAYGVG
jgi:hypothetical protein